VTVVDRCKLLESWAVEEETKRIAINVVTPLGKATADPAGPAVAQFSRVSRVTHAFWSVRSLLRLG
jgi:hypothetical protein